MTPSHLTALPPAPLGPYPLRVGVLDGDLARAESLCRRLAGGGLTARPLPPLPAPHDLAEQRLHALVLEWRAPGEPWGWLEAAVAALPRLGIVVVADHGTLAERVRALRLGADDWVARPCDDEELAARVEAVLRRRCRPEPLLASTPVTSGELLISPQHRQVFCDHVSARLRGREFAVLHALASDPGRVISREELYARVWGCAMVAGDRSVDVHVCHVRRKLARVSTAFRYVHTHPRVGYRFEPEEVEVRELARAA
ncbi:response regulator transcription factor [Conexibacter sp. JD483]|uniref:response regulator transcription factor n=1 Tax=unclassified Conexibacter TaxID=2627773 RepID=UPI00271BB14A|nr:MULTISPECIES: response regulator transcription factor [unclassified Conexibacter]MDO8186551.1 response regulator transcription factor [Conexibacter sp. CPCC 205706]MDO8200120.1 response regulator transcription factor [Conexibacter sp. CPCC 205762]MDR9372002.1 response regulator transcription factor [Conexibacter sp. JD483]